MLLRALQEGIAVRRGITVVIGGTDENRTALCRALAADADQSTFTTLLLDSVNSEHELLSRLLRSFGVMSRNEARVGHRIGVAQREMVGALEGFLRGLRPIGAAAVLIVNRAHRLPIPVLLYMANLARLEAEGEPLLQIVLTGTPELETLLRDPEMSELNARVSTRYEVEAPAEVPPAARPWGIRPTALIAVIAVVLVACVLAVVLSLAAYRRLGY